LSSLEKIIGPIVPAGGLCSTFRSEIGTGACIGDVVSAKLTGSSFGELSLRNAAYLDETPYRYDVYANLRFWRLGLRGAYSTAETRSRLLNSVNIDFTGASLGCDLDAVQLQWMTFGSNIDFYFMDPRFQGAFVFDPLNPNGPSQPATIDLIGDKPITWGTYLRYIPPEILGFPVHFEAVYKVPLKGSKLTIYGASLVFRPQIYRFDVSCRLLAEKTHLKFQNETQTFVTPMPLQNWEVDMEWKYFGVELAVYF
jgi:hypothetical protein